MAAKRSSRVSAPSPPKSMPASSGRSASRRGSGDDLGDRYGEIGARPRSAGHGVGALDGRTRPEEPELPALGRVAQRGIHVEADPVAPGPERELLERKPEAHAAGFDVRLLERPEDEEALPRCVLG